MDWLRKFPEKILWRIYYICLAVIVFLDFYWLYTHVLHYHFSFQYIPQFFALLGFGGCISLIIIAKAMGVFIVVNEDYFQKKAEEKKGDPIE